MEKLTWDYGSGLLRLPSFKNYYLAAQIRFISSFFEGSDAPFLDTNRTAPPELKITTVTSFLGINVEL